MTRKKGLWLGLKSENAMFVKGCPQELAVSILVTTRPVTPDPHLQCWHSPAHKYQQELCKKYRNIAKKDKSQPFTGCLAALEIYDAIFPSDAIFPDEFRNLLVEDQKFLVA